MNPFYTQRGFTLLIAILVTAVTLAIGAAILNVTLKELILTGLTRDSYVALNAADAGMECALYWDTSTEGDRFDVGASPSTITCMGTNHTVDETPSGGVVAHDLTLSWGSPEVCAQVTVIKYYNPAVALTMESGRVCPAGSECTYVVSRGYNRACSELGGEVRIVERALRAQY